jgi:hypothetical protein
MAPQHEVQVAGAASPLPEPPFEGHAALHHPRARLSQLETRHDPLEHEATAQPVDLDAVLSCALVEPRLDRLSEGRRSVVHVSLWGLPACE